MNRNVSVSANLNWKVIINVVLGALFAGFQVAVPEVMSAYGLTQATPAALALLNGVLHAIPQAQVAAPVAPAAPVAA